MHNKSAVSQNTWIVENIFNWQFGIGVLAAHLINMFWGKDPVFGIFIALLSLVYFLPVNAIIEIIGILNF